MKDVKQSNQEYKPENWLLEEYKLLSSHYFHEDNQMERTTALFTTINGILLTFLGSSFSINNRITTTLIPIVGIVFSVFWLLIHNRVRLCRKYNESRIFEIEKQLHEHWGNLDILPLDIRLQKNWGKKDGKIVGNLFQRTLNKLPSSFLEMVLPITFFLIWLFILLT